MTSISTSFLQTRDFLNSRPRGGAQLTLNSENLVKTDLEKKRAEYCEALEQGLNKIVTFLSSKPEVERVILFGSYASGRRDLFTDLDLLVVMNSHLDFVSRTASLQQELDVGVDLDLLVYTPQEFARRKHQGMIRQALQNGKVLYEKNRS